MPGFLVRGGRDPDSPRQVLCSVAVWYLCPIAIGLSVALSIGDFLVPLTWSKGIGALLGIICYDLVWAEVFLRWAPDWMRKEWHDA